MPTLDVVRGHGICYRRITIRGHDDSLHPFAIQYPAARHCRREERIIQLFRILSGVLSRRKESRKRGLTFNLPAAVPLAPHIRIVQDDPSDRTVLLVDDMGKFAGLQCARLLGDDGSSVLAAKREREQRYANRSTVHTVRR